MQSRMGIMFASLMGLAFVVTAQEPVVPQKGGEDISGPYEVVPNWPQPISKELTWGRTSSVFAESPDRVFVVQSGMVPWTWKRLQGELRAGAQASGGQMIQRADNAHHCNSGIPMHVWWKGQSKCKTGPDGKTIDEVVQAPDGTPIPGAKWENIVMVFNREGGLIEAWDQWKHLLRHPHQIMINPYDPEKHVWIVDSGSEQIYKFTHDGKKLVMTLGEFLVEGDDERHFGAPTGIAFLPNGDFYLADGYHNARVAKFSKDGKFLMQWGKVGKGPGEFTPAVHSIAADAKGQIYVADRGASRIQIFDGNGKYVDEWRDIRFPLYIAMSKDQHLWVADGQTHKILKYNLDGQLLYSWGTYGGETAGHLWGTHAFHTDSEGNFYSVDVFAGRPQKFRPKKGANPKFLVGPLASPGSMQLK